MCRHCERLVVHPEDKQLMHDFMERTALRVNELHVEHGLDVPPVTANDIDLKIEVTVTRTPNPIMADYARRLMRDLSEMHR